MRYSYVGLRFISKARVRFLVSLTREEQTVVAMSMVAHKCTPLRSIVRLRHQAAAVVRRTAAVVRRAAEVVRRGAEVVRRAAEVVRRAAAVVRRAAAVVRRATAVVRRAAEVVRERPQ